MAAMCWREGCKTPQNPKTPRVNIEAQYLMAHKLRSLIPTRRAAFSESFELKRPVPQRYFMLTYELKPDVNYDRGKSS